MADLEGSVAEFCLTAWTILTFDFTEPTTSFDSLSRHNVLEMASSSTGSPRRVPVPWTRVSQALLRESTSTNMRFEVSRITEVQASFLIR